MLFRSQREEFERERAAHVEANRSREFKELTRAQKVAHATMVVVKIMVVGVVGTSLIFSIPGVFESIPRTFTWVARAVFLSSLFWVAQELFLGISVSEWLRARESALERRVRVWLYGPPEEATELLRQGGPSEL